MPGKFAALSNALADLILAGNRHSDLWSGTPFQFLWHQRCLPGHGFVPRNRLAGIGGFATHDGGHRAVGDGRGSVDVRRRAADGRDKVGVFLNLGINPGSLEFEGIGTLNNSV